MDGKTATNFLFPEPISINSSGSRTQNVIYLSLSPLQRLQRRLFFPQLISYMNGFKGKGYIVTLWGEDEQKFRVSWAC